MLRSVAGGGMAGGGCGLLYVVFDVLGVLVFCSFDLVVVAHILWLFSGFVLIVLIFWVCIL